MLLNTSNPGVESIQTGLTSCHSLPRVKDADGTINAQFCGTLQGLHTAIKRNHP